MRIYKSLILTLFVVWCLPIGPELVEGEFVASVNAQSVDLLWQAHTYTPPFYSGKALWSNESRITFWAKTEGLGDPSQLRYKWTKTGTVLGNINGVGKNTLSFNDTVLSRPQTIRVDIVTEAKADGRQDILATASVYVAPTTPSLATYENNPLYGFMFHRETMGTYRLEDQEVTFAAFPLFFSASRGDKDLGYKWITNAGGTDTENSVTYRSPDGASGTSQVEVSVTSADKITQSAAKNFLVQFGK